MQGKLTASTEHFGPPYPSDSYPLECFDAFSERVKCMHAQIHPCRIQERLRIAAREIQKKVGIPSETDSIKS